MGLWTLTHFYNIIPAFAIYILAAVAVRRYLSGRDEGFKYRILKALAVTLLILEAIKQVSCAVGGYDLYSLPFHYCSIFLYVLPIHAFYRGKYKRAVDAITLATCASLCLFMLVMPAVVYSQDAVRGFFDDYTSMHTVLFHHLVNIYFFAMLGMRLYSFEPRRDLKPVGIFLAVYVIVATVMSFLLETNFHNLYRCNLEPVENIRLALVEAIGWPGHAIYVAVMFIMTIIFAYAAYALTRVILSFFEKRFGMAKKD
jgi:hypothetical protein